MSNRKSIGSLKEEDLRGKRVLVRVDFNVPLEVSRLDPNAQAVADKTKIIATLPTIQFLNRVGARTVLCSHLGRPKGRDLAFSLEPIVQVLKELLPEASDHIKFVNECVGSEVDVKKEALDDGDILVVENLRFHAEETANSASFAGELAQLMEIYVNDAFGSSHRAHASTVGVTEFIPRRYSGFLMDKELAFLDGALRSPNRPLVAVVGGAKVSTKLGILLNLLDKVDKLLVGGAMVYTFYRALGYSVGDSLVEEDLIQTADAIMKAAEARKIPLVLASDSHIVPTALLKKYVGHMAPPSSPMAADTEYATHTPEKAGAELAPAVAVAPTAEGPLHVPLTDQSKRVVQNEHISDGWTGVDIGPASINLFTNELELAQTVLWNGPMGVCENPEYAHGTVSLMQYMSHLTEHGATTIVCGGDTVAAVLHQQALLTEMLGVDISTVPTELTEIPFSHISTGGGAALEFLEGKILPGVAALEDA